MKKIINKSVLKIETEVNSRFSEVFQKVKKDFLNPKKYDYDNRDIDLSKAKTLFQTIENLTDSPSIRLELFTNSFTALQACYPFCYINFKAQNSLCSEIRRMKEDAIKGAILLGVDELTFYGD